MTLPVGVNTFTIDVEIPIDYSGPNQYTNTTYIDNISINSPALPFRIDSDDPSTPAIDDETLVDITRADNDGDNIPDCYDLDDDNDGILDTEELNHLIATTPPDCTGETILDFSATPTLETGTALQEGAVYRFDNVSSGIDALVTVVKIYNASIGFIDDNGSDPAAFKPQTNFDNANLGKSGFIEYRIQFVSGGGTTPVSVPKFFMNINDVDGDIDFSEKIQVATPVNYIISNPTELSFEYASPWFVTNGSNIEFAGSGNANPEVNIGVIYENQSEISLRTGVTVIVPKVVGG